MTVKKLAKVLLGLLVVVGVIVGSFKIMEVVQKNEMKYLDADALIDKGKIVSYQIDEASIEHNPMGGIMFTVLLNDDSELYVRMTLEKDHETGKIQQSGGGYAKKVKDLVGKKD